MPGDSKKDASEDEPKKKICCACPETKVRKHPYSFLLYLTSLQWCLLYRKRTGGGDRKRTDDLLLTRDAELQTDICYFVFFLFVFIF